MKRRELLEKKKAIEDKIKAASAENDHLASLPAFHTYSEYGLSVVLESGHGNKLSSSLKQYIQSLLKINMEAPFGLEWPTEAKVKRKEMVDPNARYIFVYEALNASGPEMPMDFKTERTELTGTDCWRSVVGFVHYRFIVEEKIPVLYVYELQLEPRIQGKGLGRFLMQLMELIAHKTQMGAVVLTVQKANKVAINFYRDKLRYTISSISPSKVDPVIEDKRNYEILCKALDDEARSLLET